MTSKQGDVPECVEPPSKKPKVEEEADDASQQLVERKWVKVDESEAEKNQCLLKVMQWNSLADGESAL